MDLGAITLGLHLMSQHLPGRDDLSGINPGAYVLTESGITAGALRNSRGRLAAYAGWSTEFASDCALTLGVMRYARHYSVHVVPMAVPSCKLGDRFRLSFIPPVQAAPALLHLSLEFKP